MEINLNTNTIEYKKWEIEVLHDIWKKSKSDFYKFSQVFNEIIGNIESEKNQIKIIDKEMDNLNNKDYIDLGISFDNIEDKKNINVKKEEYIYDNLTKEINNYEKDLECKLSYYENNYLCKYQNMLKKYLYKVHRKYLIEIIGSYKTKTNICDSNIDFIVKIYDNKKKNIEYSEDLYNILLKNKKNVEVINFMKKSSFQAIWVLKFNEDPFHKIYTLFFPNELNFISKISYSIIQYNKDFPLLKTLARIIKEIMSFGKFIEKSKNGITSYLLILMIISYWQFSYIKGTNNYSVGYHFVNLLKFYVNFKYYNNYLSPNLPLKKVKELVNPIKLKNYENIKNEFIIIDPFNKNSNLNKNWCMSFQKIKDIFQIILFNIYMLEKGYLENIMNIAYTYREIRYIK